MKKRKQKASLLVLAWLLMAGHCLADKVFAHWHFENSHPVHHHHPHSSVDISTLLAGNSPIVAHSHPHEHSKQESEEHGAGVDCCKSQSLLVRGIGLDHVPVDLRPSRWLGFVSPELLVAYAGLLRLKANAPPPANVVQKHLFRVLISSNAPPEAQLNAS